MQSILKYWWIPIFTLWIYVARVWVFLPYIELKQQQALLINKERELIPSLEENIAIEETIHKLEKVRQVKHLYTQPKEFNKLINDIVAPDRTLMPNLSYQLELGQQYTSRMGTICPLTLEMEASFNYLGDYLEYLEAMYIPWRVRTVQITPAKYEFDRIHVQLSCNILLFQ
jgi:hypothetical protein